MALKPLSYTVAVLAIGVVFWLFGLLYDVVGTTGAQQSMLTFDVLPSNPVGMIIHNTKRYELTHRSVEDYAALLPPGGHLIYLGSPPKAYTPTLFHQMKCLGILHAALADVPSNSTATPSSLVSHCLNYLRQTILCRPNLRLESATNGNASSEKEYETVCRNWEAVYEAAERNYESFSALQK